MYFINIYPIYGLKSIKRRNISLNPVRESYKMQIIKDGGYFLINMNLPLKINMLEHQNSLFRFLSDSNNKE